MTVLELMKKHKAAHKDSHFFDDDTLKFFGERISEMKIEKDTVTIIDYCGKEHQCYVLSSYQRKYPTGARRVQFYFDVDTFDTVDYPANV